LLPNARGGTSDKTFDTQNQFLTLLIITFDRDKQLTPMAAAPLSSHFCCPAHAFDMAALEEEEEEEGGGATAAAVASWWH